MQYLPTYMIMLIFSINLCFAENRSYKTQFIECKLDWLRFISNRSRYVTVCWTGDCHVDLRTFVFHINFTIFRSIFKSIRIGLGHYGHLILDHQFKYTLSLMSFSTRLTCITLQHIGTTHFNWLLIYIYVHQYFIYI